MTGDGMLADGALTWPNVDFIGDWEPLYDRPCVCARYSPLGLLGMISSTSSRASSGCKLDPKEFLNECWYSGVEGPLDVQDAVRAWP